MGASLHEWSRSLESILETDAAASALMWQRFCPAIDWVQYAWSMPTLTLPYFPIFLSWITTTDSATLCEKMTASGTLRSPSLATTCGYYLVVPMLLRLRGC